MELENLRKQYENPNLEKLIQCHKPKGNGLEPFLRTTVEKNLDETYNYFAYYLRKNDGWVIYEEKRNLTLTELLKHLL